jgi:mitochondrial-processing peptidase subunit beta
VELLGQVVLQPAFDSVRVEALKATIHKNASSMDPFTISTESAHYTAFRDHYLGQPASGIKDVVYSITADQVKQFHQAHYVGKNIVVSGAGNINADSLNSEVSNHFGAVPASRSTEVPNADQPYFTPSLLYQRDDEMLNTAFSVAFEAPSWNDPDFFAMNYFKRIIGEYRCDKFTGDHLNSPHLQYNSFHTYLGNNPDLILHKPFYFAYSDTGLFGNFIYGNEMYSQEMSVITQNQMSVYAQYVSHFPCRSTSPKSSEPETSTSTTFSSSTSPPTPRWPTPSSLPTSTV